MDVCAALIAHLEPSKAIEPGQCPLDHPAIAPQPLTRLDATPSDARDDAPPAQRPPAARSNHSPYRHAVSLGAGVAALVAFPAVAAVGWRRWRPSSRLESWTLDPEMVTANGTPWRSTTIWRFVPNLPRFVGSLPVCSPPQEPAHSRYRVTLASSRCALHPAAAAGACDASASTRLLAASRASAASTSCHSHSPSPGAASPTECRFSRQRRCPSRRRDLRWSVGDHPWAWVALAGRVARRSPTARR